MKPLLLVFLGVFVTAPSTELTEDQMFERLVKLKPPGQSMYSVEPALCHGMKTRKPREAQNALVRGETVASTFYGGCVKKETVETGRARYRVMARAMSRALSKYTGDARRRRFAFLAGIGVNESGFREDVMVGRGRHGRPSDDGGEGRGPSNEACVMQIHPKMGGGDHLLGTDEESLVRCFEKALTMIEDSIRWCGASSFERVVSYYATGQYCNLQSDKVRIRARTAERVYWSVR